MFGGTILKALPVSLLSWPSALVTNAEEYDGGSAGNAADDMASISVDRGDPSKKRRRDAVSGSRTPTLISSREARLGDGDDPSARPLKRLRSAVPVARVLHPLRQEAPQPPQKSQLLNKLPDDVLAHCLSFLSTSADRFALQTTCKAFRKASNSDDMLSRTDIMGGPDDFSGAVIRKGDNPATATIRLAPFARASNLEALYMLGIIKCYCYQDLNNGIRMLKLSSSRGFVRSSYMLGVILRDALPAEAAEYMSIAASKNYFPALQEILPGREMKARFGEPTAEELEKYLDPKCLNQVLLQDYVKSVDLRALNTSHCWNPLCGKWAYKANSSCSSVRMRRGWDIHTEHDHDGLDHVLDLPAIQTPPLLQARRVSDGAAPHSTMAHQSSPSVGRSSLSIPSPASTSTPSSSHESIGSPARRKRKLFHAETAGRSLAFKSGNVKVDRVSRMKMCSRCCRAKYCSKLCQVYDWRSSQHKMACQFL